MIGITAFIEFFAAEADFFVLFIKGLISILSGVNIDYKVTCNAHIEQNIETANEIIK